MITQIKKAIAALKFIYENQEAILKKLEPKVYTECIHEKALTWEINHQDRIAGENGEITFYNDSFDAKWIMERIPQCQDSFKKYTNAVSYDQQIKRGDFICRNCNNVEIDVKCIKNEWPGGNGYFKFELELIEKHLEMEKLTNTPVLLAIYEKSDADTGVVPNSLRMIRVSDVSREVKDEYGNVHITFTKMTDGFMLLEKLKEEFYI